MEHTIENITRLVAQELGIEQRELKESNVRSNHTVTLGKQLVTYFAKEYTSINNTDIKKALGYSVSNRQILYKNTSTVRDMLNLGHDEKGITHYQNINKHFMKSTERFCTVNDTFELHIDLKQSNTPVDSLSLVRNKQLYPFIIRHGNVLYYSYGKDKDGIIYGQTKEEYTVAKMTV